MGWFRGKIKEHGVLKATLLLGRVAVSRTKTNVANKWLTSKVSCPCCGWQGREFYDYIEVGYRVKDAACPKCESHPRQRHLFLWARQEFQFEGKTGIALVFAPEKALASLWTETPRLKVYRVDVESARGVDLLADMQNLPIASDSVDVIWCHHVLEHIENDREAIKELSRVLRPDTGELVVSVPMEPGTVTEEYGFPDPTLSGHWRMYGDDFVSRLGESGLDVNSIDFDVSAQDLRHYALEWQPLYSCRKVGASQSEKVKQDREARSNTSHTKEEKGFQIGSP